MALSDIQFKKSGTAGDCLGGAIFDEGAGEQSVAGAMPSGIALLRGNGNPEGGRNIEFQPATATGEPKVVRVTVYDNSAQNYSTTISASIDNGISWYDTPGTSLTAKKLVEKIRTLLISPPFAFHVTPGDVVVGLEQVIPTTYGTVGDYSYIDITGNDTTDFNLLVKDKHSTFEASNHPVQQQTIQNAEGPHAARVRFDNGAWVDVSTDGNYTLHSGTDDGFIVITVTAASLPTAKVVTPLDIRTTEADLFSNISGTQGLSGFNEYKCVYLVNNDSTAHDFTFYIPDQPVNATLSIGLGTAAANGTEQTIANINTAPTGVTFAAPVDSGTSTITQTLAANEHKSLWIHRALTAGNYGTVADDLSKIAVNIL